MRALQENLVPAEYFPNWTKEYFGYQKEHGHFPRGEEFKKFREDFFKRHNIPLQVEMEEVPQEKNISEKKNSVEEKNISVNETETKKFTTRSIIPSCPVDYFLPYNFGFSEKGITRSTKSQGEITVSHTPVVITRRFIEPTTYKHKYEIAFLNPKNIWIKKTVDVGVLADQRKIIQLADYGIGFTSSEAKYLSQFLNDFIYAGDNAQKMTTIDAYNQPGWDDEYTKFIYPTGDENYICHRNGFDYEKLFKSKGDKNNWVEKFRQVQSSGGSVARIILGAATVAPIVKPMNLPNIQAHIHGKRGIGKTSLPKFAASIFGDPRAGRLSRTFAGTMKNKLETAAAFNCLPMILDELETIGSKYEEAQLSKMIYDYSLGVANQANKRDGSARPTIEFSGSRISTGERPLVKSTDKGGAFKRVLDIRVQKLFDDEFASELHSFSENNFGLFGKEWIDYITQNLETIRKEFHMVLNCAREAGVFDSNEATLTKVDVEPTQLKAVIACAVAYKHFAKMIGVEYSDEQLYTDIAEIVFNLPTTQEIADTQRAKDALASFIAGHKKYFVTENKSSKDFPEIDSAAFETYGKIFDNGEVAVLPHKLKQILENELGFASAEKLIAEWADEGKLRRQGNGYTYKTRINNQSMWTYRFKANILIPSDIEEKENISE